MSRKRRHAGPGKCNGMVRRGLPHALRRNGADNLLGVHQVLLGRV